MAEIPGRFARLVGVPVVHAAHAGEFDGGLPLAPGFPYRSYYLGETQILDGAGRILARMRHEDGEGFVSAELDLTEKHGPREPLPAGFWIPSLPRAFRRLWTIQNLHGWIYYRRKTLPHRKGSI